jgi:Holliday junction DNA helicase RuvB
VGATTRAGLLPSPLRDRFGFTAHLDFYNEKDIAHVITRSAELLKIVIDKDAIVEVAGRSRGTPRIANRLLRRVRDFAQIKGNGHIDLKITQYALDNLQVDSFGLDEMDNRILSAIIDKFKGGPVGLNTIATAVGEEGGTIEEVYEPFLIMEGFLVRTQRGREVTEKAYRHLGKSFHKTKGSLFEDL